VGINPAGCRAAIVAAHPDDETIGAGEYLRRLASPAIIHVTDGAPRDMKDAREGGFRSREEYAQARRREFLESLRAGGVRVSEAISLDYIDQEASLHLVELARDLCRLFGRLKLRLVLTHPYEGGHPDHDATAFAVQAACQLLPAALRPQIIEFTSYHDCAGQMETGVFLPEGEASQVILKLDAEARARKERMLACYRTQERVIRHFSAREERFRPAPAYDFVKPPHSGELFYEHFSWGMTSRRWTDLARVAADSLSMR